ncbi:MAG TPA: hypothetical protein VLS49_15785, partial [Usitatibacter sp.]|nr:hypothetical protein [Usitatibacter sp.]
MAGPKGAQVSSSSRDHTTFTACPAAARASSAASSRAYRPGRPAQALRACGARPLPDRQGHRSSAPSRAFHGPMEENRTMPLFSPEFLSALAAIIVIDLALAGDNAIVIALAARDLPANLQRRAIVWGTFGAIA